MRRRVQLGVLAYVALRWVLLATPGYVADIQAYEGWALRAAQNGLSQIYATSHIDYPPLYAWILYPLGKVLLWFSAGDPGSAANATLANFLMKLPPLMFDAAIALLMFRYVRRFVEPQPVWSATVPARGAGDGNTGAKQVEPAIHRFSPASWAWIIPLCYLMNPAVLFNNGYWGEPDSIHSFFLLAAFLSLGLRRQAWPAWVLWTLATLMKPLGAPFAPLLAVLSVALFGIGASLIGVAAAVATLLVFFSPFLLTGQGATVIHRVLGDVTLMAYTSSNAHNLWWALGGWRDSEAPWLGPITATQFGLGLFGLVYVALLWKAHRLHRSQRGGLRPTQIVALAAAVGFSFFMLSTHMHENHLFVLIPLLLPLLPASKTWRWIYGGASLAVFLNLILHDLVIPERWPFTIGGPTGVINRHLNRPFAGVELGMIRLSTAFNLAFFAIFLVLLFRPGGKGLLDALGSPAPADRPRPVPVEA